MKKYRVSLSVDENWVKRFDLTFEAENEQDAEAQAMIEVKQNVSDYITAYADEEENYFCEGDIRDYFTKAQMSKGKG